MDGHTDMEKIIGVIRDYKKAPKTGFIERAVLICDLDPAYLATFKTAAPTKTSLLLFT
jgi:hypothetical protein